MGNGIRLRYVRIFGVAVLFAFADFASHGAAHRFTATLNWKDDGGTPLAPAHEVPVPVRISTALIPDFDYDETANGTDFEITDENGSVLPYEIDVWNPSGESLLWVKVPDCHDGQVLTIVYGRTNANMTDYSPYVWSGYAGVWHMNEVLARDSASGHYDGQTATGVTLQAQGRIGPSLAFDGTYSENVSCCGVSCGEVLPNSQLTNGITVSCWVKPSSYSGERAFFGKEGLISMRFSSPTKVTVTTPGKKNFSVTNLTLQAVGEWCHLAVTFDESLDSGYADVSCFVYTNGVMSGSYASRVYGSIIGYAKPQNPTEMFLGRNQWYTEPFAGEIDELRCAPCVMTAGDIAAAYAAMTKATFTYGAVGDVAVPSVGDTYYHFAATVSNAVVNASGLPFENMPVLLKLAEGRPAGFSYNDVVNSGRDFEITDESGNALPYEIDTWNPNGESLLWVRVPSFDNGRRITVTYGRSLSDGTASAALVWNGYAGVWHLGAIDYMASAFGTYPNSTVEAGIDGVKAKRSIADEPGVIGKSVRIANGHDKAKFWVKAGDKDRCRYGGVFVNDSGDSSPLDLGDTFTISGWFKYDATNAVDESGKSAPIFTYYDKLFFKRSSASATSEGAFGVQMQSHAGGTKDKQEFCIYGSGNDANALTGGLGTFTLGEWGHVAFVYNVTNCYFYTNGVYVSMKTVTKTQDNNMPLCFGNKTTGFGDGSGENSWNGWIDEVRLQDGARTSAELAAEFAAMSGEAFDCGTVVTNANDATTPSFEATPTFASTGGDLVFSVSVTGGRGTVFAEYVDVYTGEAVTNEIATLNDGVVFPLTITDTPSLANAHAYVFAAIARNADGTQVVRMPGHGTVYFGTLDVAAVHDADEAWLHKPESNGVFRISRAASDASVAEALEVSFSLTGDGIEQGAARRVGAGTTATIKAGESSVDVAIVPVYNTDVTETKNVTLTVVNANVKPSTSSTATISVASTDANLMERYVAENGSDDNLGVSPDAPMRSPVTAVNAIKLASMSSHATVHVAPGLYPVNFALDLTAPIRVQGEGVSPLDVVITNTVWASTASGINRIAALDNADAVISGVTMTGAGASGNNEAGFCFTISTSGGMVSNCVVQACGARGSAYAAAWLYGSKCLVSHTVFRDITPGNQPGGHSDLNRPICITLSNGAMAENCLFTDIFTDKSYNVITIDGSSSMRNCTVAHCTLGDTLPDFCDNYNHTKRLTAYAVPVYCDSVDTKLVNCAFAGVCDTNGIALPPVSSTNNEGKALVKMSCCLMDAKPLNCTSEDLAAAGNIVVSSGASIFRNYARGDYLPKMDGPLVNAGTNYEDMAATDLAGRQRKVGKFVDIGCYENGPSKLHISIR